MGSFDGISRISPSWRDRGGLFHKLNLPHFADPLRERIVRRGDPIRPFEDLAEATLGTTQTGFALRCVVANTLTISGIVGTCMTSTGIEPNLRFDTSALNGVFTFDPEDGGVTIGDVIPYTGCTDDTDGTAGTPLTVGTGITCGPNFNQYSLDLIALDLGSFPAKIWHFGRVLVGTIGVAEPDEEVGCATTYTIDGGKGGCLGTFTLSS